jgi:biopolymer transport protein ExbD
VSIVFLILLIFFITKIDWDNFLTKNPIKVKFDKNPLNLIKKTNSILEITIKNNTAIDIQDAVVNIESIEDNFIIFCKDSTNYNTITIPIMSAKNKRTIYCDVRPKNKDNIIEGTYSFNIEYILNQKTYTKRTNLEIIRK